ncbi:MAG: putative lipid II flippase FtsW [Candidatus Niyogibacteria bacterium]|nr:MAG: putative lipid II flippase FtsW [Candidatus Niyogibacteria bacterium]
MPRKRDSILFGIILAFVAVGALALMSASLGLFEESLSPFKLILRQLVLGLGLGFLFFYLADKVHYRFWHKTAFWIFLASLALTILVFVPGIGFESGGAKRWISFGPLFMQPSEFLKIGFVIYLAAWLSSRGREVGSMQFGAVPIFGMILAMSAIFFKQPDLGTLGVIIISSLLLFFTAGGKLKHLGLMGVVIMVLLAGAFYFRPYSLERIQVFLNSDYDPQGAGYQVRQASIAFGSGGIFGKGFGQGLQKYNYLPEPTADAIFAVIGEEFGFVGASFLVLLFIFFLWRSTIILRRTPDIFARLLGSGIVILIVVQAFINMSALTGLLPLTGLTLPFMSQGGSSLIALLAAVGVLSNISKYR